MALAGGQIGLVRSICEVDELNLAVCILAKDESGNIADVLTQLARQSLIAEGREAVQIHVVANGCTDDTAAVAQGCDTLFRREGIRLKVHDIQPGGKSRAWNRTVHEFMDGCPSEFVFLDADIQFVNEQVLSLLVERLRSEPEASACAGYPVKDVSSKERKNLLDRLSLRISKQSRHVNAISGQLYAARGDCLREIWLPDETPGEDGFLNAMMTTSGFTRPPTGKEIVASDKPTHYFHAHHPSEFIPHERRLIVGTVINCWIFEHLWSLELTSPAGQLIRDWNRDEPDWVEKLIRRRAGKRPWLISNEIVFGRLSSHSHRSWVHRLAYLPVALAATALTLPPAVSANRRLKHIGAARTW